MKSILFKKRIYGGKQEILLKLAQLKMLGVMEIGPYIGVMLDGSTAYYYDVEKGVNMDKKMCDMCGCY